MRKYLKLLAALLLATACTKEAPEPEKETEKETETETVPVTPPETDDEPQVEAMDFKASLAEQPGGVDKIFSLETGAKNSLL